jgi:hypothetical protein
MPATKALFYVVILAVIVGSIVFAFFPEYRPGVVQNWIDVAMGLTPAESPRDAIDKFRSCLQKHDFRGASLYLGGEYGEVVKHVKDPAGKLAGAVDDLLSTLQTVGINAPDGKHVIDYLQPFPKDFDYEVTTTLKDSDLRTLSVAFPKDFPSDKIKSMGDKVAVARLSPKLMAPGDNNAGKMNTGSMEKRIFLSLVPLKEKWDWFVGLKEEGEGKQKGWKVYIPVTPDLQASADYLKQNYGNYTQALRNVKQEVKRDAATKSTFESELSRELYEAK